MIFLADYFAGATMTKHHKLRGLNDRNVFSRSPGGWSPTSRFGGVASSAALSLPCGCLFSLCPHMAVPCPPGSGPTPMTSCYCHHLFKDRVSTYSHLLRSWGSGLQHVNLGARFSHSTWRVKLELCGGTSMVVAMFSRVAAEH